MRIMVYRKYHDGTLVFLDHVGGEPVTFPSVKEAIKFLYQHNFTMDDVKDFDFDIITDDGAGV